MSETKGVQRFWTPEVEQLAGQLKQAQMKKDEVPCNLCLPRVQCPGIAAPSVPSVLGVPKHSYY